MMMMENPRVVKTMNGVQVSAEDTEISIFDAKRYFNESNSDTRGCKRVSPLDIHNSVHDSSEHGVEGDNSAVAGRFSSDADGYGYGKTCRVRSFHATPTPSWEASWNSQTGLLSNPTDAIAVSMTTTDDNRKRSGKKRWVWRPCCPCSGNKSVQVELKGQWSLNPKLKVDDQKRQEIPAIQVPFITSSNTRSISEEKHEFHSSLEQRVGATTAATRSNGSETVAGFTFPILNQQPKPISHVEMAVNRNNSYALVIDHDYEDPPGKSLDVFLPPDESSNTVPKKLVSRIPVDDDVVSDTSSDLFEIESLSTTTKGQSTASQSMYNRRDSLDDAMHFNTNIRSISDASGFSLGCPYSPMVIKCYEPSEASIEWNVAAAEGFERGSVRVPEAEENMHGIGNYNGGKKTSGDGGLQSCRNHKAVSVGSNPVKYVPHREPAATPTTTEACGKCQ